MKRMLALLLVLGLLLAGCASGEPAETKAPETTVSTEATEPNRGGNEGTELETVTKAEVKPLLNRAGETVSRERTLMIYMVGSNLESESGLATRDLYEMEESGVDLTKNNVLVYTGGTPVWHYGFPSEINTIQELSFNGFSMVAETDMAYSTGDPGTLMGFLDYAYKYYPAEEYDLIFWDHGNGAVYGFGGDLLFEGEGLYLNEIAYALENSPFAQEKLRFVGFDACLMATVETAATLAPYADYLIASEELEPGTGWNYSSLASLDASTEAFAETLITDYGASLASDRSKPRYSLSCMDLTKTQTVLSAMDSLFGVAREGVLNGDYSAIAKARIKTEAYGLEGVRSMENSLDMIDLKHVSQGLETLYPNEAKALNDAISQFVVHNLSNIKNTNGVSVYFPHYNTALATELGGMDLYRVLAGSDGYKDFLQVYVDMLLDGDLDVQWQSDKPLQEETENLSMEFTVEESDNIGRIYYNVLIAEGEDSYRPVLSEAPLAVDANGKLQVPRDPQVIVVETDVEGHKGLFHFSNPVEGTYVSDYAIFMASDDVLTGSIEPIQIALGDYGDALSINSIVSRKEGEAIYARAQVNTLAWAQVAYYSYVYTPVEEDGVLLPVSQWESDGSFYIHNYPYDLSFTFHKEPLSQQEGDFYAQLCVEDTRGQMIYSQLVPLMNTAAHTEEVTETEKGAMTFHVYEDYAKLVHYEGEDEALVIPDTVGGQPVTVIGEKSGLGTFYLTELTLPKGLTRLEDRALANYSGTELTIPEGVTYIGYHALASSKLETIKLPQGVRFVAGNAFAGSHDLTAIEMERPGMYKSVDGVLFSGNGKMLVAYPAGGASEYTVPEEVVTIGYSAFSGNYKNLTKVNLPEGLETISHMAFAYCEQLTDLVLPESLGFIGHSAFATDIGMPKGTGTTTIHLGENVWFVGTDAFSAFELTSYSVDPMNTVFSASENGALMNYAGTQLIAVPAGAQGVFEVPYGVCMLGWHCLQDCNGITELILPDTVAYIDLGAGCPANLERLVVGSGLVYWGNEEDFASVPKVEISSENPYFG